MEKIQFIKELKDFHIVDTIFDDIIAESEFSTKIIRIYNNIIYNKLDYDFIDNNNNKLNTTNLNQGTRKSSKIKCSIKDSDISNNQKTLIIILLLKTKSISQLLLKILKHRLMFHLFLKLKPEMKKVFTSYAK